MKKSVLILLFLFSNVFSRAQILNGGFENWTNDLPDNWWAYDIPGYNLYEQTTDANSGMYAVHLRVDTLSGFPASTPLSTGDGVNINSHPTLIAPDGIGFWYKLNPAGGDLLALSAIIYNGGAGVGSAFITVSAAATYTFANAPVFYTIPQTAADSVSLIFFISNQAGPNTFGSEAWIDDVSFTLSPGISEYNNDFVKIFPNPAANDINISVLHAGGELYIYDALGRQCYSTSVSSSEMTLPAGIFQTGIYHCIVKDENEMNRISFVKY